MYKLTRRQQVPRPRPGLLVFSKQYKGADSDVGAAKRNSLCSIGPFEIKYQHSSPPPMPSSPSRTVLQGVKAVQAVQAVQAKQRPPRPVRKQVIGSIRNNKRSAEDVITVPSKLRRSYVSNDETESESEPDPGAGVDITIHLERPEIPDEPTGRVVPAQRADVESIWLQEQGALYEPSVNPPPGCPICDANHEVVFAAKLKRARRREEGESEAEYVPDHKEGETSDEDETDEEIELGEEEHEVIVVADTSDEGDRDSLLPTKIYDRPRPVRGVKRRAPPQILEPVPKRTRVKPQTQQVAADKPKRPSRLRKAVQDDDSDPAEEGNQGRLAQVKKPIRKLAARKPSAVDDVVEAPKKRARAGPKPAQGKNAIEKQESLKRRENRAARGYLKIDSKAGRLLDEMRKKLQEVPWRQVAATVKIGEDSSTAYSINISKMIQDHGFWEKAIPEDFYAPDGESTHDGIVSKPEHRPIIISRTELLVPALEWFLDSVVARPEDKPARYLDARIIQRAERPEREELNEERYDKAAALAQVIRALFLLKYCEENNIRSVKPLAQRCLEAWEQNRYLELDQNDFTSTYLPFVSSDLRFWAIGQIAKQAMSSHEPESPSWFFSPFFLKSSNNNIAVDYSVYLGRAIRGCMDICGSTTVEGARFAQERKCLGKDPNEEWDERSTFYNKNGKLKRRRGARFLEYGEFEMSASEGEPFEKKAATYKARTAAAMNAGNDPNAEFEDTYNFDTEEEPEAEPQEDQRPIVIPSSSRAKDLEAEPQKAEAPIVVRSSSRANDPEAARVKGGRPSFPARRPDPFEAEDREAFHKAAENVAKQKAARAAARAEAKAKTAKEWEEAIEVGEAEEAARMEADKVARKRAGHIKRMTTMAAKRLRKEAEEEEDDDLYG